MVLINALTDQAVELHYVSENMLHIIASYYNNTAICTCIDINIFGVLPVDISYNL